MSSNQTLDVEALDDASVLGLVEGIVALRKQAAQVHAAEVRLLATAGELAASRSAALRSDSREREMHLRSIAAELALAVRASDRTVQRQINDAVVLAEDFTPVLEALEEGRIFVGHARVILDAGTPIQDPEARLVFAADAVARAENLSPARLRPAVEALAERLQPRTVTERHRDARADRAVTVTDRPDGMGELIYIGPATLVHGIYDRLTQQARAVRNAAQPGASFGPAAVDPSAGRARVPPRRMVRVSIPLTAHPSSPPTRARSTSSAPTSSPTCCSPARHKTTPPSTRPPIRRWGSAGSAPSGRSCTSLSPRSPSPG
ncbi:DUF222 domain-containing protein [Microbacterium sp. CJ77]|uniref:DUF222 domain-containing protein n=1 Tax=Microbacterium sp. CJ77 TaxID=2079201 RepID=UPI000CD835D3|nr:DUF222 domain-containing protein [Microbacterium sp. CJ77]